MLATFSLHSVVTSVGAWCGLAALIGLALLVLLYFAQARELRRMADWIVAEEERRARTPLAPSSLLARTAPGPAAAPGAPPPPPPAAGGVTVTPGQPLAPGAVVTAVPGTRRVAVPGVAGAPSSDAPHAPNATIVPGAVLAPATAAAMAAAADAPPAPERPASTDSLPPVPAAPRVVAIPVSAPDLPAEAFADEPGVPERPAGGETAVAPAPVDETAQTTVRRGAFPPAPAAEGAAPASTPPAGGGPGQRGGEPWRREEPVGPREEPGWRGGPQRGEEREVRERELETPAPAVPLVARRIPIAEVQAALGAGDEPAGGVAASPLDLLRANPHAPQEDDETVLRPSTAAGSRTRFPPSPSPSVRVAPGRGEDATMRAPGRGAPGGDPTERPRRRREVDEDDGEPRTFGSTLRLLVIALVIVAILIVVATQVFGSGGGKTPPGAHTTTTNTHTGSTAPAGVLPSQVTVAVLNGTTTSHLAGSAWTTLASKGFRKGAIANAARQTVKLTRVGYTAHHRGAAVLVAADLSLPASSVHRASAASLRIAERAGGRPQVVVTLGADYARR